MEFVVCSFRLIHIQNSLRMSNSTTLSATKSITGYLLGDVAFTFRSSLMCSFGVKLCTL
jgi:hypothetical protein